MAQWKVHVFAIPGSPGRAVCCCVALGKCLKSLSLSSLSSKVMVLRPRGTLLWWVARGRGMSGNV